MILEKVYDTMRRPSVVVILFVTHVMWLNGR